MMREQQLKFISDRELDNTRQNRHAPSLGYSWNGKLHIASFVVSPTPPNDVQIILNVCQVCQTKS